MQDPISWNKLGCTYFAEKKWLEAIDAFQQAIALRADFLDAYYNLGLAQSRLNRFDQAMVSWRALLELAPAHLGANFQIGSLLMRQRKFDEALNHFSIIEKSDPTHLETQANMAICCIQLGWLNEAKKYYANVLRITPDDVDAYYNLGVIHAEQGKLEEAVNYYLKAIEIKPDFFAGQNNLGATYLALKRRDDAKKHFQEALNIEPGNEAIRHTLALLSHQKDISVTPQSYISSLFDSYADHYDSHLTHSLHYQVPAQMYDLIHHSLHLSEHQWRVLDLGCGTGLCGQFFREAARVLVGVDLSARMLDAARDKRLYDELVQADVLDYLKQHATSYDLIMAGDTLVYMGNLSDIFAAVSQSLRSSGYFIFNAEAGDGEEFQLMSTGRFTHRKDYLDQLVVTHGFHVLGFRAITLRLQDSQAVPGYLYLIQK